MTPTPTPNPSVATGHLDVSTAATELVQPGSLSAHEGALTSSPGPVAVVPKPATGIETGIDLAAMRLRQDFPNTAGVRKVIMKVPIRKPQRQEFVRVRAGAEWRYPTRALRLKQSTDEWYLVLPALHRDLATDLCDIELALGINMLGDIFLWPLRLPAEGRTDPWAESALGAAKHAENAYIRMGANTTQGCYDIAEALGQHPQPDWPELTFEKILQLAFASRVIDTPDHPVVRALKGL